MSNSWGVGTLVWAKMKSFPPWPGVVAVQPANAPKRSGKKQQHWVFFFGSKNYAWIDDSNISSYIEHKAQYCNSSKSASFKEALDEIEKFLNSLKDDSQYSVEKFLESHTPNKSVKEAKADQRAATNKSVEENRADHRADHRANHSAAAATPPTRKRRTATPAQMPPSEKRPRNAENTSQEDHSGTVDLDRLENVYDSISQQMQLQKPIAPTMDLSFAAPEIIERAIVPSTKLFGFIGLGLMGTCLLKNLIITGHTVNIWNRTKEKAVQIKEQADKYYPGKVEVYDTPSDLFLNSDIVLSCLPDAEAVKSIVFSNCGILHQQNGTSLNGKGYVNFSSIDIETSKDVSKHITLCGGKYVEAPMQGTKKDAESAMLVIMGAGDEQLFKECTSCFKAIGRTAIFLGSIGSAILMNLILQSIRSVQLAGLSEAFVLAYRAGLKVKDLVDIMSLSSLGSPALMASAETIRHSTYRHPYSTVIQMQSDMKNVLDLSHSIRQSMPMVAAANEALKHTRRLGCDRYDASSLFLRSRH